jgi:hypothetical protein
MDKVIRNHHLKIMNLPKNLTLATLALGAALTFSLPAQTLFSDDFEGSASDAWGKWVGYPNVTVTDNQNRSIEVTGNTIFNAPAGVTFSAYQGTRSGKLWELFWYEGTTANGGLSSATFAQWSGAAMTPLQGKQIQFDLQSFTSQYDGFQNGNSQAYMFVKFFNSDYSYFYASDFYTTLLSDNTMDSWQANTLSFTVPSDAAIMQIGIENKQLNWGGGSVYVDNALITVVPEPSSLALLALGLGLVIRRRK